MTNYNNNCNEELNSNNYNNNFDINYNYNNHNLLSAHVSSPRQNG